MVLGKIKQLFGLLLTLHKRLALYGLIPPDKYLCKVSYKPNN